jgi:hypothetical protein
VGIIYLEKLEMERPVTRESVLALILEKEKIEAEMSQLKSVLDRVSVVVKLFDVSVWSCHPECACNFCIILYVFYVRHVRNDLVLLTGSQ